MISRATWRFERFSVDPWGLVLRRFFVRLPTEVEAIGACGTARTLAVFSGIETLAGKMVAVKSSGNDLVRSLSTDGKRGVIRLQYEYW